MATRQAAGATRKDRLGKHPFTDIFVAQLKSVCHSMVTLISVIAALLKIIKTRVIKQLANAPLRYMISFNVDFSRGFFGRRQNPRV